MPGNHDSASCLGNSEGFLESEVRALVSQRGVLMALSLPLLWAPQFLPLADGWVSVSAAGWRGERSNRGLQSLPEAPSSYHPAKTRVMKRKIASRPSTTNQCKMRRKKKVSK